MVRSLAAVINIVVVYVIIVDDVCDVSCDLLHIRIALGLGSTLSITSRSPSLALVVLLISHGRFVFQNKALLRIRFFCKEVVALCSFIIGIPV